SAGAAADRGADRSRAQPRAAPRPAAGGRRRARGTAAMRTVLLHGFTGGASSFADLGLDAVTPELPGHGSAPAAVSWEDALTRLEPLLDPGPVILGGYSMGARIALGLALRRPDKVARLVLASGTAGIEDEAERARRRADDEELARFIEAHEIAAFVDRWETNEIISLK